MLHIEQVANNIFKIREKILFHNLAIIKLQSEIKAWKPTGKHFQVFSKHSNTTKEATTAADLHRQSELAFLHACIKVIKDDIAFFKKDITTLKDNLFQHIDMQDLNPHHNSGYLSLKDIVPELDVKDLKFTEGERYNACIMSQAEIFVDADIYTCEMGVYSVWE